MENISVFSRAKFSSKSYTWIKFKVFREVLKRLMRSSKSWSHDALWRTEIIWGNDSRNWAKDHQNSARTARSYLSLSSWLSSYSLEIIWQNIHCIWMSKIENRMEYLGSYLDALKVINHAYDDLSSECGLFVFHVWVRKTRNLNKWTSRVQHLPF